MGLDHKLTLTAKWNEVKHRSSQEAALDEVKYIEDAPRAPIAIGERMNRLELVVQHRQLHQGINGVFLHRI